MEATLVVNQDQDLEPQVVYVGAQVPVENDAWQIRYQHQKRLTVIGIFVTLLIGALVVTIVMFAGGATSGAVEQPIEQAATTSTPPTIRLSFTTESAPIEQAATASSPPTTRLPLAAESPVSHNFGGR